jgi:hypothetical protein
MEYEEYVQFCLDTYREGLSVCPQTDLLSIVVGNIDKVRKTYLSAGGIEDFVEDVRLDVLMLMDMG